MSDDDKEQCLLKLASIAGAITIFAARFTDEEKRQQAQELREIVCVIQDVCTCIAGKDDA